MLIFFLSDPRMNSFVCVCSAEHCDDIEETGNVGKDELVYFLTSRDQHRMKRHTTTAGEHVKSKWNLDIRGLWDISE
jgi:hypothetical protein